MNSVNSAKIAAWSILAVTIAAWLLVILFGLASWGTPHYYVAGAGWSQAEIDAQTHFTFVLNKLFLLLPAVLVANIVILLLIYRQKSV